MEVNDTKVEVELAPTLSRSLAKLVVGTFVGVIASAAVEQGIDAFAKHRANKKTTDQPEDQK